MDSLQSKVDEYKNSLEEVAAKRMLWQNTTKQLIYDTLSKVAKEYDLGWHVQRLEWLKNYEGINLTFGSNHSGISEETERAMKSYVKRGPTLVFSQSYNGDIMIFIVDPIIEEIITRKDETIMADKVLPNEINEKLILSYVAKLLDNAILFEKNTRSLDRIGFITKNM